MTTLGFYTDYRFTDRQTKARYVWLKYQSILKGCILDEGTGECHLKQYLPDDVEYWGIGLRGQPDQQVDLEKERIPFPNNSFDCVLCLDVREHLDNIHELFDELCRVTRRYVIISLPNPWADFYNMLRFRDYRLGQHMKFYGLPLEKPEDRHKWFFSNEETEKFVLYRAAKNCMRVLQMDNYGDGSGGEGEPNHWKRLTLTILFRNNLNLKNLYHGPL